MAGNVWWSRGDSDSQRWLAEEFNALIDSHKKETKDAVASMQDLTEEQWTCVALIFGKQYPGDGIWFKAGDLTKFRNAMDKATGRHYALSEALLMRNQYKLWCVRAATNTE